MGRKTQYQRKDEYTPEDFYDRAEIWAEFGKIICISVGFFTLELWKFGTYKHYTSLKLLTNILNIPSPKDDISGADVCKVYYQENDQERIVKYCEKDVVAIAQVILKLRQENLLKEEDIIVV